MTRRPNWRLVIAGVLAALLISAIVVQSLVGARAEERKDREAARRDHYLQVERHEAAAERKQLLDLYNDLADTNAALVAWLQAHGIRVPVNLIARRVDVDGDGKDDSDSVDRDAVQREQQAREQATRPKAPGPSKGNGGGGSGGNGGGDGPGNGGQSHGHSGDSHGRSHGGGSGHSEGHSRGAEHRRHS